MTTIWILLLISLVLYELITMNIIAIFYFCGIILSLLIVRITPVPNNYIIEIVLAIILGTILLYLLRDKLKEYLIKRNILLTDKIINKKYKVEEDFKHNKGHIRINNKKYYAISEEKINKDDEIIVEKIVHNKLIVRKKD